MTNGLHLWVISTKNCASLKSKITWKTARRSLHEGLKVPETFWVIGDISSHLTRASVYWRERQVEPLALFKFFFLCSSLILPAFSLRLFILKLKQILKLLQGNSHHKAIAFYLLAFFFNSIMSWSFNHIIGNNRFSFFFIISLYVCVHMYVSHFLYPSTCGMDT